MPYFPGNTTNSKYRKDGKLMRDEEKLTFELSP